MFPYYNQYQFQSYQQMNPQNQYIVYPQQNTAFYPGYNSFVQIPQNVYFNINQQDLQNFIKTPTEIQNQNIQTNQNVKNAYCNCSNTDCRK